MLRPAWCLALVLGCRASKPTSDATVAPAPAPAIVAPPPDASALAERPEPPLAELTVGGVTFRRGDRVRVTPSQGVVKIGTVKPAESGHPRLLEITPGLTGVAVGFLRIENYNNYGITVELAVVQWDAQVWHEPVDATTIFESGRAYTAEELAELNRKALTAGPEVALPSFESTLNISYLTK